MRRTPRAAGVAAARSDGRHWKMALCSLSIGSSVAPPSRSRGHEQRAGHDQRFLVREQDALAGARRGERRRRPAAPTIAAIDRVDFRQRRDRAQAPRRPASTSRRQGPSPRDRSVELALPRRASSIAAYAGWKRHTCSNSASTADRAVSATTSKRSGWRAMTSSVDAPIEPGRAEDRRSLRCACVGSRSAEQVMSNQRGQRHRGGQRVDAVEHAAVTRQNVAAVLDAALRFSHDSNRSPMIDSPVSSSAESDPNRRAAASSGRVEPAAAGERQQQQP